MGDGSNPPAAPALALVTGASRGIGRAVARELAARGCDVVLVARTRQALQEAASDIAADTGRRTHVIAADLSSASEVDRVAGIVGRELGRLDVLVNNAGATSGGDVFSVSEDDWAAGFALKFFGYVRMCRALWPLLAASRGNVVNVIGTAARTPTADFVIGGSVNAAVASFTKALAETGIRDGVRVNAVHPGPVMTARMERLEAEARARGGGLGAIDEAAGERGKYASTPEDCACVVAFLASSGARRVVGEFITVDGGMTRSL